MPNYLRAMADRLTEWASENAEQYLYVAIPRERTDTDYDDAPLQPYRSYFRLWLSEMFLTRRRLWFNSWCPAVHASVSLNYGGQPAVSFHKVASLPEELQSKGVMLNYNLSELMPFNGGTVEITAGLLAMPMQGNEFLKTAIKILGDFAALVAPPLGPALAISRQVAGGIEQLMSATGGQVHASWHQKLSAEGGGRGHTLCPGYLAVIIATAAQINESGLFVKNDRLHYVSNGRGEPMPLEGFDYMLFRIEGRKERDDWRLKNIQEPVDSAIQALLRRNQAEADAYALIALTAAYQSPDLAVPDRRRVVEAIKEELEQVQTSGLGIHGDEDTDLNHIMEKRANDLSRVIHMPPLSFDEALGRLKPQGLR